MAPYLDAVYGLLFPKCTVESLQARGQGEANPLDQFLGIDAKLHLPRGAVLTVQQKVRRHKHLVKYGDFTQEYKNAEGTSHERPGEWFHLHADLYLYAWANATEDGLEKWVLLNVPKYKATIDQAGGLDRVGTKNQNWKHGRSSFYSIPLKAIRGAIVAEGGPDGRRRYSIC